MSVRLGGLNDFVQVPRKLKSLSSAHTQSDLWNGGADPTPL